MPSCAWLPSSPAPQLCPPPVRSGPHRDPRARGPQIPRHQSPAPPGTCQAREPAPAWQTGAEAVKRAGGGWVGGGWGGEGGTTCASMHPLVHPADVLSHGAVKGRTQALAAWLRGALAPDHPTHAVKERWRSKSRTHLQALVGVEGGEVEDPHQGAPLGHQHLRSTAEQKVRQGALAVGPIPADRANASPACQPAGHAGGLKAGQPLRMLCRPGFRCPSLWPAARWTPCRQAGMQAGRQACACMQAGSDGAPALSLACFSSSIIVAHCQVEAM